MNYKIGDRVKFHKDIDSLAGEIIRISIDQDGPVYTFTSKAYDSTTNSMVEGVKIAREEELVEEGVEPTKDEVENE